MECRCLSGFSSHSNSSNSNYLKAREYLTKEEKAEILKEYQRDLEKEVHGISQKIKELKED